MTRCRPALLLAALIVSGCATAPVGPTAAPVTLVCQDGSAPLTTEAAWSYVVSLPKFFDSPFACRCEALTATQCARALKVTNERLLSHVSNATISPACTLGLSTIVLPK